MVAECQDTVLVISAEDSALRSFKCQMDLLGIRSEFEFESLSILRDDIFSVRKVDGRTVKDGRLEISLAVYLLALAVERLADKVAKFRQAEGVRSALPIFGAGAGNGCVVIRDDLVIDLPGIEERRTGQHIFRRPVSGRRNHLVLVKGDRKAAEGRRKNGHIVLTRTAEADLNRRSCVFHLPKGNVTARESNRGLSGENLAFGPADNRLGVLGGSHFKTDQGAHVQEGELLVRRARLGDGDVRPGKGTVLNFRDHDFQRIHPAGRVCVHREGAGGILGIHRVIGRSILDFGGEGRALSRRRGLGGDASGGRPPDVDFIIDGPLDNPLGTASVFDGCLGRHGAGDRFEQDAVHGLCRLLPCRSRFFLIHFLGTGKREGSHGRHGADTDNILFHSAFHFSSNQP